MATTYYQQLVKICGKDETRKDGKDLLNIARSKTGPGSGRDLGSNAIALPAICAFLASERLGNNDVSRKMAQDVSCLRPKDFEAALSTVRSALSGYLSRKPGGHVSLQALCRTHGLNEDALYWMEQVDKELRKSGELDDVQVDEATVLYMVFYWACIALNIRSVKQSTIVSDYGVPLHVFQDLEHILDSTCEKLKESMDKFVSESRSARSTVPTPSKTPRRSHPLKERTGASLSPFPSPARTPTKMIREQGTVDVTPSKRKAILPPLPFMTPTKKQKATSPIKLNRLPVMSSNLTTPPKGDSKAMDSKVSPTKTYRSARSFADSPVKSILPVLIHEAELTQPSAKPRTEKRRTMEPPSTPAKNRVEPRSVTELSTPSPRKSVRLQLHTVDASTPTRSSSRPGPSRIVDRDVHVEGMHDGSSESSDEEDQPPPCRHYIPAFADRLFYHYRDPRVSREWRACEESMQILRGDMLGKLAVH